MRITSTLTAAVAGGAVTLLVACSSGSSGSAPTLPGAATHSQSSRISNAELMRTGIAPKYFGLIRFGHTKPVQSNGKPPPASPRKIFVTDFGTGATEVVTQKTYLLFGTISNGMDGPDGATLDSSVNLYVANYAGIAINQYFRPWPGASVNFTYNAGMADPVDVAVDKSRNVYEADYDSGNPGWVQEYAQGSNSAFNTCSPGGAVEGVAIDSSGDVFVSFNSSAGGKIAEYVGGLSGCNETVLPISLTFAGGLAIDKSGNLIACDQSAPAVDVIAPPYTSITGTLGSGYSDPFHVSINKHNNKVLVADPGNANVQILSYPSGSNIATLNYNNGLSDPADAVWSLNAVY